MKISIIFVSPNRSRHEEGTQPNGDRPVFSIRIGIDDTGQVRNSGTLVGLKTWRVSWILRIAFTRLTFGGYNLSSWSERLVVGNGYERTIV